MIDKTLGTRGLALRKGDYQPPIKSKIEEQTERSRHMFLAKMDAIACGVEARYELTTGHSIRVIEETVDVARTLGMPEDEIGRWAAFQLIRDTERSKVIKSILERLQKSSPDDGVESKGHLTGVSRSKPAREMEC